MKMRFVGDLKDFTRDKVYEVTLDSRFSEVRDNDGDLRYRPIEEFEKVEEEEMETKVGGKFKCVGQWLRFTVGKIYEVKADSAGIIGLIDDDGDARPGIEPYDDTGCFELLEERFKKGDRIRIVKERERDWTLEMDKYIGKEGTIESFNPQGYNGYYLQGNCWKWHEDNLILIKEEEKEMSIKDKIEGLTGWDKEADDILEAIPKNHNYYISVAANNGSAFANVSIYKDNVREGNLVVKFKFCDQCEKLQAFKDALLWLAEQAGMIKKYTCEDCGREIKYRGRCLGCNSKRLKIRQIDEEIERLEEKKKRLEVKDE